MPFGNDHADHVYVSGLGFVSGRDPLHFVERDLRRSSSAAGISLLLLLVLPAVFLWPVEIFSAVNAAIISAVFGSGALSSVTELFRELRELFISLLTWGTVLLLLKGMLHPPKTKPSATLGTKRSILCALLIVSGITALDIGLSSVLQDIMGFFHLVEMNPASPMPTRPMAVLIYLLRLLILPAVFEELIFRRCLLQALRRHGDSFALFFSSLCGGLIHYTVTADLTGFVVGLVLGYFFLRTGSLKTVIGCRLLTLAAPLLLETVQGLLMPVSYQTVRTLLLLLMMIAGLAGFVLFCRWNHNAYILDDSRGTGLLFHHKLRICLTCRCWQRLFSG